MVQKVPFSQTSGNTVTLGTGASRVIMGADSGNLKIQDSHSNTSVIEAGLGVQGAGSGVVVVANNSVLPLTGSDISAGALAWSTANNTLFVSNGTGWYKITTVNLAPTITLSTATVLLGATGNQVDVTYTTTEPEGTPVTVAVSNSGVADTNVGTFTHTSANNTIRIINTTGGTGTWAGSMTATVSDGVNTAADSLNITVKYSDLIDDSESTTFHMIGSGNDATNQTFVDSGASAHTVTAYGNAHQTSFSPYSNYSWRFNGDQYLEQTDDDSLYNLAANSFTLEFWIKPSRTDNNNGVIAQQSTWSIDIKADDSTRLALSLADGTDANYDLANEVIISNGIQHFRWHHIAVVRNGNTLSSYHNGALVYNNTSFTGTIGNSEQPMKIGKGKSRNWYGYICDLRLVLGTAVYTGVFTPPKGPLTKTGGEYPSVTNVNTSITSGHTKMLTCNNGYVGDQCRVNANRGGAGGWFTRYGSSSYENGCHVVPTTPYRISATYTPSTHGGSVCLDHDTPSYLTLNTGSGLNAASGTDFTLEFWVYFNDFSDYSGGYSASVISIDNGATRWQVAGSGYEFIGWSANWLSGGVTLNHGTWQHYALQRKSGAYYAWFNGVRIHNNITSRGTDTFTSGSWGSTRIGLAAGTTHGGMNGYISDLRYVLGTAVYPVSGTTGAATIPLPKAPLTTTGGTYHDAVGTDGTPNTSITASETKILLNFNNAKLYDNARGHGVQLVGDVKTDTSLQKYSIPSVEFDGSGDYIQVDGPSAFIAKSGTYSSTDGGYSRRGAEIIGFRSDFTIEGWVNFGSALPTTNAGGIFQFGTDYITSAATIGPALGCNGTSNKWRWYYGTTAADLATGPSTNTWYHFAWVHYIKENPSSNPIGYTASGGRTRLFIDGVMIGDVDDNTDYQDRDALTIGGYYSTTYITDFNMSDFRISQAARYPFNPKSNANGLTALTTTNSYQSGRTSTASNVKLLACHTSTVTTDGGADSLTISNPSSGIVASTNAPVGGMHSAYFDGTSTKYLSIADGTYKTWGATFTVECWFNTYATSGNQWLWGDFDSSGNNASASFTCRLEHTGVRELFNFKTLGTVGASYGYKVIADNHIRAFKWYHMAITRESGTMRLFLDGNLIHEYSDGGGTISDSSQIFTIGRAGAYNAGFQGYISNFRINQGEAIYQKNFTVPATALPS